MTIKVPQPIGVEASWHLYFGFCQYACSTCSCEWLAVERGEPNVRCEWCDNERCSCHDERFAAAVYEGSVAA